MALDELMAGGDSGRAMGAILFISASTNAFDIYSALNSSPWTAESFGGDPDKAKACREYVYHSLAVTAFYSFGAAAISRSWWPIWGWAIASAYMFFLYERALTRAAAKGSTNWSSS
jgi:hypothetical protein